VGGWGGDGDQIEKKRNKSHVNVNRGIRPASLARKGEREKVLNSVRPVATAKVGSRENKGNGKKISQISTQIGEGSGKVLAPNKGSVLGEHEKKISKTGKEKN